MNYELGIMNYEPVLTALDRQYYNIARSSKHEARRFKKYSLCNSAKPLC
jgi:hypothetical protein